MPWTDWHGRPTLAMNCVPRHWTCPCPRPLTAGVNVLVGSDRPIFQHSPQMELCSDISETECDWPLLDCALCPSLRFTTCPCRAWWPIHAVWQWRWWGRIVYRSSQAFPIVMLRNTFQHFCVSSHRVTVSQGSGWLCVKLTNNPAVTSPLICLLHH